MAFDTALDEVEYLEDNFLDLFEGAHFFLVLLVVVLDLVFGNLGGGVGHLLVPALLADEVDEFLQNPLELRKNYLAVLRVHLEVLKDTGLNVDVSPLQ